MDKCKDARSKLEQVYKKYMPKDSLKKSPSSEAMVEDLNNILTGLEQKQRANILGAVTLKKLTDYMDLVPEKLKAEANMDMIAGGGIRQKQEIYDTLVKAEREDLMIFMTPLERQVDNYFSISNRMMADASEEFRMTTRDVGKEILGFSRDKSGQRNMIHAIFGKKLSGDDQALQFAKSWGETVEVYRKLFNKFGGDIAKLDDYKLPQHHDSVKIHKAQLDTWKSDIKDLIETDRLLYDENGKSLKLTDKEVNSLLDDVYRSLTNEGTFQLDVTAHNPYAKAPMNKRHQEHRMFHFKDSDAWLKYADKYGANDYYQSMMDHLEMMSREIAAMERLGPNPDAMVRVLQKQVQKSTGKRSSGALAVGTYDHLMRKSYGLNPKFRDTMGMLRNLSLAPKIGGAVISAISDIGFLTKTLQFNGIPIVKTYGRFLKNLSGSGTDRVVLAKIGLLGDYANASSRVANRFSEVTGFGWSARLADFVVRASGLNHWTYAVKNTFGLEFASNLSDMSKIGWGQLPKKTKLALTRYGVNEADWKIVQASQKYQHEGVSFLDPGAISAANPETSSKIISMIREETFFAAPEPGAKARTIAMLGTTPGTLGGEMVKTSTQLKSFPISIMTSHFMRAMDQGVKGGVSYMGSLLVGTTILGGVALQAKNLLAGKTMEDWDNPRFVAAAFAQGGAGGLLADFIVRDHTKASSFADFTAGPLYGDIAVVAALVLGSPDELNDMSKNIGARYGGRVKRVFDRMVPDTWATRVVTQRWVKDQFGKIADPNWESKQRRMRTNMKKTKGQRQWWKSGDLLP